MAEAYIAIGIVLGLIVGMLICRNGINERDKRIEELENELNVKQNIIDSQNERINVQRKIIERNNGKRKTGTDNIPCPA
jgi:uncharacterized membrane-anchored protein YhcB (DUF1043 family)